MKAGMVMSDDGVWLLIVKLRDTVLVCYHPLSSVFSLLSSSTAEYHVNVDNFRKDMFQQKLVGSGKWVM